MQPTRIPYEESSVFSRINIQNPQLNDFPSFALTTPFIIDLEPGDVLFVPHHWWHFVECLETSVSVNTWLEIKEDDASRLEEAIIRTLISMFIDVYETDEWLNPNEKLELPDTNMDYIYQAVEICKTNQIEALNYSSEQHGKLINYSPLAKRHRSSSREEEEGRLSMYNEYVISVPQFIFSDYMDIIRTTSTYKIDNQLPEKNLEVKSATTAEEETCSTTCRGSCSLNESYRNKPDTASTSSRFKEVKNKELKKHFMNCILHPNVISEIATLLHKECSL